MNLPISWQERAVDQFEDLPPQAREAVMRAIEALNERGLAASDGVKLIVHDELGELFRLKVREERGGRVDHRVFFDIVDGELRILGVYHRDEAYEG
ncbi:MAG: hypothetical protein SV186_04360 [Candidatus Nanohaloarchaea archaeon]|nr:hypothetical protein [Candidatus Nanohaloarchaea archaeon]